MATKKKRKARLPKWATAVTGGRKSPPADMGKVVESLRKINERMMASLTPQEQKVLRMRFGISEKDNHKAGTVGEGFKATRQKIKEIEARALKKLAGKRFNVRGVVVEAAAKCFGCDGTRVRCNTCGETEGACGCGHGFVPITCFDCGGTGK